MVPLSTHKERAYPDSVPGRSTVTIEASPAGLSRDRSLPAESYVLILAYPGKGNGRLFLLLQTEERIESIAGKDKREKAEKHRDDQERKNIGDEVRHDT
jgi:hypothetical protein